MESKTFKLSRRAAYYETDQMGIIHHSNYIRYFEETRIEFMYSLGCDIQKMEDVGIIIPNVDAYAKYIKPIRFHDEIEIEAKITHFNGVKMKIEYTIRFADTGEISATGFTTHCTVNTDMKPISIKRTHPEFYNILKEAVCNTEE